MADKFDVGDVIRMKKPHPCGSYEWEILRVGADFRLKCAGCGHQIMVSRKLHTGDQHSLFPGESGSQRP